MNQALLEQIRRLEEDIQKLRVMAEESGISEGGKTGTLRDLKGIWGDYGPIDEDEIDAARYRLKEDEI